MPTIRPINAGGQAAILNIPSKQFPADTYAGEEFLGNSIAEIGRNLGIVAGDMARVKRLEDERTQKAIDKLQKQQDELDIVNLSARYDAGLSLIEDDLKNELDPQKRPARYVEKAQELYNNLVEGVTNPNIQRAFQKHTLGKFPGEASKVIINSRKQQAQNQVVELQSTLELLSNEAAKQGTQERNEYIRTGIDLIRRSPHFPDEKSKAETIAGFASAVEEKQMKMMVQSHSFDNLFTMEQAGAFDHVPMDKRASYLEEARGKLHTDEVRRDAAVTKAKNLALDVYWDEANHGSLNKTRLETDRMIPEHNKAALIHRNDNPIYGDAGPIRSLVQEYMLGERTVERVKAYRAKLNDLNQQMGGLYNEEIKKFGDTLQTDETAAGHLDTAKIAAGIKRYNEDVKVVTPRGITPRMDKLTRPGQIIEEAEDRGKILRGADPTEVIKQRIEKRKRDAEKFSGPGKLIQELNKSR